MRCQVKSSWGNKAMTDRTKSFWFICKRSPGSEIQRLPELWPLAAEEAFSPREEQIWLNFAGAQIHLWLQNETLPRAEPALNLYLSSKHSDKGRGILSSTIPAQKGSQPHGYTPAGPVMTRVPGSPTREESGGADWLRLPNTMTSPLPSQ